MMYCIDPLLTYLSCICGHTSLPGTVLLGPNSNLSVCPSTTTAHSFFISLLLLLLYFSNGRGKGYYITEVWQVLLGTVK